MSDPASNLNPTVQAKVAMIIWGQEYSNQRGGAMDFWNELSKQRKSLVQTIIETVLDHHYSTERESK